MFNWQNQMRGGMPQMGQQGPPMGGQQGPPPGGMPPPGGQQQPRPGPAQLGPGMGGGQPQMPPGGFSGARMANQPGSGASGYQSQIDDLQQQLMMAQANGAPPQVIGNLQLELQQAQRAMQQAGMQAMYGLQQNRPQPGAGSVGTGGRGGSPSPYYGQQMNDWNAQMQLLMGLYGMGGGGRGIGG